MYLSNNPRVRFAGPDRAGLGNPGFWDSVENALYQALSNASSAVTNITTGELSPAQKQQIDAANQAAIAAAAGVNNPNVPHSPALDAQYQAAAQQAIQKYRDEVAVVYAQASGEATQANVPKYLLIGAAALGIYLVATR